MNKVSRQKSTHIHFDMILQMAIANLSFKRFRSAVTILAVVIGIGSIYLLVSFGMGLQNLVQGEIIGNQSINTIDITPANSSIIKLSPENMSRIKSINHITDVSGIYMRASQVTLDGSSVDLVAYGVDSLYLGLSNLNLVAGSLLDPDKDNQLVINKSLLEAVGIKDFNGAVGKEMSVNFALQGENSKDKKMRITGIIDSGSGSEIFVSQRVFKESGVENYTQAKAVVDERINITDARRSIESLGYETTSPVDTIDQINEVFRVFNVLLIGLGSTGMFIAILGMLNTLTVSLLERTREIALMITIGARPKDMQRLFMTEAVTLSLTGGVVGISIATVVGAAINLVLNQMAYDRGVTESFSLFAFSPLLIVSTLSFMIVMGVIVSFVPARRAAKINPITALHQE